MSHHYNDSLQRASLSLPAPANFCQIATLILYSTLHQPFSMPLKKGGKKKKKEITMLTGHTLKSVLINHRL